MSLDVSLQEPEAAPRKFADPDWTATRGAPRHRGAGAARDAVDQHRHALQHHLPELLHRIEPEQRPARLHHGGGGGGVLRRDRGRRARHPRDRLHRRRAVHEPASRSPWWGMRCSRGFEVLLLTNAMQPMQRPKVKRGLLELNARFGARLTLRVSLDHYTPSPARGRAGRAHVGAHDRGDRLALRRTVSGSRSPGAPAGTRARRDTRAATPASSPSTAGRSMPPTRASWCCCPRWTASTTCRRSPRAAGRS